MAYILFNGDGLAENYTKEKNDFRLVRPDIDFFDGKGLVKEVSREDYISVVSKLKEAKLQDGNITYEVVEDPAPSFVKENFDSLKTLYIESVDKTMQKHSAKLATDEFSSLNTRLNDFKTALNNFDTATISYPVTTSFLAYWFENESAEPFSRQYLL